jgi:hypothetical protein
VTAQALAANQIELSDLIDRFNLTHIDDPAFFPEWQTNLPPITDLDRQLLKKLTALSG